MNEFKFHVNRSFGTEQFTFSATVHSDNMVLTDDEITSSLQSISQVIDKQFGEVLDREIKEKKQSAERLSDRVEANKEIREAITKVNLASILEDYTPEQVDEAFRKLAQEAQVVDQPDTTPTETTEGEASPYNG